MGVIDDWEFSFVHFTRLASHLGGWNCVVSNYFEPESNDESSDSKNDSDLSVLIVLF